MKHDSKIATEKDLMTEHTFCPSIGKRISEIGWILFSGILFVTSALLIIGVVHEASAKPRTEIWYVEACIILLASLAYFSFTVWRATVTSFTIGISHISFRILFREIRVSYDDISTVRLNYAPTPANLGALKVWHSKKSFFVTNFEFSMVQLREMETLIGLHLEKAKLGNNSR